MAYFDLTVTDEMLNTTTTSLVLIDDYQVGTTKSKSEYVFGRIKKVRKSLGFKVWDSTLVDFFKKNDLRKKYITVTFQGSEWNGVRDITIKGVSKSEEAEVDSTEFESPIEYESLFAEFGAYINDKLAPNWVNVVNIAFRAVTDMNMYERFKLEFAGSSMHDAIAGGLLNHTMKMLRIFDTLEANDERIKPYSDLIRTGIVLHDLGKVEEMKDGAYQPNASILNHRIRGISYLERNRNDVLQQIDENQLARLESIILTHHGGLGNSEICNTIYAYVVHLVDMLDSQVTGILDKLESDGTLKKNSCGESMIPMDDMRLIV